MSRSRCGARDLVEAAVRTGRQGEAAAHVAALREAGIAALSPRLALLSIGSSALAARGQHASDLFERALSISGLDRWPFDSARVHLVYGEHLRRDRAIAKARAHLGEALSTFQMLGARSWATRADNELRATGSIQPGGDHNESLVLSPQEREIALLAASGLTNKEIGARLYLSHRTVGGHLYRIFPKLGIKSRAALRTLCGRWSHRERSFDATRAGHSDRRIGERPVHIDCFEVGAAREIGRTHASLGVDLATVVPHAPKNARRSESNDQPGDP